MQAERFGQFFCILSIKKTQTPYLLIPLIRPLQVKFGTASLKQGGRAGRSQGGCRLGERCPTAGSVSFLQAKRRTSWGQVVGSGPAPGGVDVFHGCMSGSLLGPDFHPMTCRGGVGGRWRARWPGWVNAFRFPLNWAAARAEPGGQKSGSKNEAAPGAWHLLPGRRGAEAFFEGSAATARASGVNAPFRALSPAAFQGAVLVRCSNDLLPGGCVGQGGSMKNPNCVRCLEEGPWPCPQDGAQLSRKGLARRGTPYSSVSTCLPCRYTWKSPAVARFHSCRYSSAETCVPTSQSA